MVHGGYLYFNSVLIEQLPGARSLSAPLFAPFSHIPYDYGVVSEHRSVLVNIYIP